MTNAQSGIPMTIEDPQMDSYLQNREPATLTIQINSAPDSVKKINIKCTFVTFGSEFQITKYYTTNPEGFLTITLTQNLPYQQIWLNVDDYLYAGIYVNTGLKVTIDVNKIKSKSKVYFYGNGITYSDTDGELNTVMNKHILFKQKEQNHLINNLRKLSRSRRKNISGSFFKKTDSIWQALTDIDNEFNRQYPKYAWATNNETASRFYSLLSTSYWGDTMPKDLFLKIKKHQPYFTSNNSVSFYNYLSTYLYYQKGKIHKIKNVISRIDSIYPYPKADILKTSLLAEGKSNFAVTYPEIMNHIKTKWCKRLVANELHESTIKQKKIDSLLASAKKINNTDYFIGIPLEQLSFNAKLYVLDSIKNVDDFILNIKSKFKGKALIIDFWATWCGPCLHDMPFSKKLHEANKDLPVEFVYICTNNNSNISLWKNKIAGLQLPGTHIFMNEKIVQELKSSFNNAGSGFPTYVVIGVNGRLRPNAIQWMQSMNRDKLKKAIGLK